MVATKLANHEAPFDGRTRNQYADVSRTAKLAISDVGLCISTNSRREATRELEYHMVASHMRIVYTIPEHRRYIYSRYPSEPILAEAASRLSWFLLRSQLGSLAIDTLTWALANDMLDRGELGELVARELLLHAYQSAVVKTYRKPPHARDTHFCQGCPVTLLITELFSDSYATKVLTSTPYDLFVTERSPKMLQEVFKNSIVRFTRFVKVTDPKLITIELMRLAYTRGMAIICSDNYPQVDLLIPVLMAGRKSHICKHTMSVIMVQAKRRLQSRSPSDTYVMQDRLGTNGFFEDNVLREGDKVTVSSCACPSGTSYEHPFMVLIMELGAKRTNVKVSDSPRRTSSRAPSGPAKHPKHPGYQVFSYGCDSSLYKVIKSSDPDTLPNGTNRNAYQNFLGLADLGQEIPRENSVDSIHVSETSLGTRQEFLPLGRCRLPTF